MMNRQPDGGALQARQVSIIIPVYNMAAYLGECLNSVLSQSHREIEAICIDDGSTDDSPAILAQYAARDPRVKVITQKNAGSGPARNAGIAAAKGDWLMFLDPDDSLSSPETVERLYAAVVDSGLKVARGRCLQVGPDGHTPLLKKFAIPIEWPLPGRCDYDELQTPAGFCLCIYERKLITGCHIEFPSFRRFQDPPFFIRAMAEAGEFMQTDIPVINRRNIPKSPAQKAGLGKRAVEKEIKSAQIFAMGIANQYGLERLSDLLGRMAGCKKETASARMIRWLCGSGKWVMPAPAVGYVDAFFDRFDAGEFHDANLFKLIQRIFTAKKKYRRGGDAALLRRLAAAKRNGSLCLSDYGRKRRLLLRWLLFKAAFQPQPCSQPDGGALQAGPDRPSRQPDGGVLQARQFLITRFNLNPTGFAKYGPWKGGDPAYLERRFALFEKYTLPSISLQTARDFKWLVFFSAKTPENFKVRAISYSAVCPAFEPIFVDDEIPLDRAAMMKTLNDAIAANGGDSADYTIVTRIDNDDALNVNALAWIRETAELAIASEPPEKFYIVMPHGNVYIENGGFTQDYTWDWNHFPTIVCRRGTIDNPFSMPHTKIGESGVLVYKMGRPHAWLEIVSGANLLNSLRVTKRTRPRYISPAGMKRLFGIEAATSRLSFLRFWLFVWCPARLGFGEPEGPRQKLEREER